jgi:D-tagatose-1,6-bisphosphate aldolase subunit GatZ/KbaZ
VNYLKDIVKSQKEGIHAGCYSACTANKWVIEAVFETAKENDSFAVIEATANQVNQFGGYTGMRPADYKNMVFQIAEKVGFDKDRIILGGDHLGPLVWQKEDPEVAMEYSCQLIDEYVMAGYTKIHIDTSMRLSGDSLTERLSDEVIAERSARLYKQAKDSFENLKKQNPDAQEPVFIVGSEVPIPGGAEENEDSVAVTKTDDFVRTVEIFEEIYAKNGLSFDDVVAVVIQPGVEFADDSVCEYDPQKAQDLVNTLKNYNGLVFEGHSTDYQTKECLREMVRDGVGILKVGPALTFAYREAIYALELVEKEVYKTKPYVRLSNIKNVVEGVMLDNPSNWEKHYHGTRTDIAISMSFSYSDRCRYYMTDPCVDEAVDVLINNINNAKIPLTLISQYMPNQYQHLRSNKSSTVNAQWLIKDKIKDLINDYIYAITK